MRESKQTYPGRWDSQRRPPLPGSWPPAEVPLCWAGARSRCWRCSRTRCSPSATSLDHSICSFTAGLYQPSKTAQGHLKTVWTSPSGKHYSRTKKLCFKLCLSSMSFSCTIHLKGLIAVSFCFYGKFISKSRKFSKSRTIPIPAHRYHLNWTELSWK